MHPVQSRKASLKSDAARMEDIRMKEQDLPDDIGKKKVTPMVKGQRCQSRGDGLDSGFGNYNWVVSSFFIVAVVSKPPIMRRRSAHAPNTHQGTSVSNLPPKQKLARVFRSKKESGAW